MVYARHDRERDDGGIREHAGGARREARGGGPTRGGPGGGRVDGAGSRGEIGRASCREGAETPADGERDVAVTGVQTCALPILRTGHRESLLTEVEGVRDGVRETRQGEGRWRHTCTRGGRAARSAGRWPDTGWSGRRTGGRCWFPG